MGLAAVEGHLGPQPQGQSPSELFDVAEKGGLISAKTKDALLGVTVMRNLAAHAPGEEVSPERAREFLSLSRKALHMRSVMT